jgi:hypothetical protein
MADLALATYRRRSFVRCVLAFALASAAVCAGGRPRTQETSLDLRDYDFERSGPVILQEWSAVETGKASRMVVRLPVNRTLLYGIQLGAASGGYRLFRAASDTSLADAPDAYLVDARVSPLAQPRMLLLVPRPPGDLLEFRIVRPGDALPAGLTGIPAGHSIPHSDLRVGPPSVILGTASQILSRYETGLARELFLLGAYFLIGSSYLILYLTRRSERGFLLFGLFCLLAALTVVLSGDRQLIGLVTEHYRLQLHSIVVDRLRFLIIGFVAPIFLDFICELFGGPRMRYPVRAAYALAFVLGLVCLLVPPPVAVQLLGLYRFVVLLESLLILYVLYGALRDRRPGARLAFPGVLILMIAGIHDMFALVAAGTGDMVLFAPALVIFVLIQAAMLSRRFAWAFALFESLSHKLNRNIRSPDDIQSLHLELDAARTIQQSLIPVAPPRLDGVRIAARYRAMQIVGGDFYDFRTGPGENTLGIVLADVSGHGIPAALIVSMVKLAFWYQKDRLPAPGTLFTRMNEILLNNIGGEFVTGCYVWIDLARMELATSNAGHPPLFLWKGRARELRELRPAGRLLGLMPDPRFDVETAGLEQGDRIVLYTDGVFEAPSADAQGEQFGLTRLRSFIAENAHLSPERFADRLMETVTGWCGGANRIADDIALVVIDVEAPGLSAGQDIRRRVGHALGRVFTRRGNRD